MTLELRRFGNLLNRKYPYFPDPIFIRTQSGDMAEISAKILR